MGNYLSAIDDEWQQAWPPKPTWSVDDIPDLGGKVAIVTGGNSGLGRLTAKYLALHNCTVYLGCHTLSKGEEAVAELQVESGNNSIHCLELDLSDLESVALAVKEFRKREERLDILFCNAGVMGPPLEMLTKQGLDLTFGIGFVGHAYLTMLLLPVLLSTAKTTPGNKVRVINVSSSAQAWAPAGGVDFGLVMDTDERKARGTSMLMLTQTRWALACFTQELNRRYASQGITAVAVNPGNTRASASRYTPTLTRWALDHVLGFAPDPLGVLTSLYAGTAEETSDMGGAFFWPWARVGHARDDTKDEKMGSLLWEFVEEQGKKIM
ncbi:NADP-binding protein [Dacryopinax primogenitus]|uniref:NADP-binding protein n=1 Tax=Dacryopinax primogenitus (strain DJM 731) TaxID=1858805 RepID=M5FZI7_DACPD|nr:NADP-binding protein [Dacryopinax primogenitus]EJU01295.1 NADP-binding protein [Dacryopinax primogenitus]